MPMKNPPHPGTIAKHSIKSLGLTVKDAAAQLGVERPTLSKVLNGRAAISTEMAIRFEKGIGSTAEHWLRMQLVHDLAKQKRSKIRVRKLTPPAQRAVAVPAE